MENKQSIYPEKSKNQFLLLIILFLALPFIMVSCDLIDDVDPITIADEYEPNNTLSEAYAVALGTKYKAKISEETDDDWFKITPSHGRDTYDKVQISVTDVSADLKIRLELYSAEGKSLESHGTSTGGQTLTYTFATPGVDYYVRFSGWDGFTDHRTTGSYSFTVSNMNANDEFAPNHTIGTAKPIEFGTPYNGVLVSKYEDDYYKFTNPNLDKWSSYTINLTNVSEDLKVRIRLYGADKSVLDSKGSGTAGADFSYTFVSKEDEFYLQVLGWDGFTDYRTSGSYTLTVSAEYPNDEFAPNHTIGTACPIELDKSYNGVIVSIEEDDWFKITPSHDSDTYDEVQISVTDVSANLKIHLELCNAEGVSVANHGASTGGQALTYTFATPGVDYYVRFSGWDGFTDHRTTGSYSFTVSNMNANDEFAPNHTIGTAYPIELDKSYNGVIVSREEDDWFKITPSHGIDTYDKVQISVTDVSTDLKIHLELCNADGVSVANHGASTGGQALTYTFATPGVDYYVRFSGWDGFTDHRTTGSYSFTVSNMNANDEFAPNHTIGTAKPLEFGGSYNGVIVSKYEDDYYKFTNPTPDALNSYTFNFTNISEDLKVRIRLYRADKSVLDSKGSGTAGADLSYTFDSKENEFYLQVLGWDGYSDHKTSGSYTLTPVVN
jgi:hypothetical protein